MYENEYYCAVMCSCTSVRAAVIENKHLLTFRLMNSTALWDKMSSLLRCISFCVVVMVIVFVCICVQLGCNTPEVLI